MKSSIIFMLFLTMFLSGCIVLPYEHDKELTPVLSGLVLDNETGKPIKGVKITIFDHVHKTNESISRVTDSSGEFSLPSITQTSEWKTILLLAPYTPGCGGTLRVEADGYTHIESTLSDLGKSVGFCDDEREIVIKLNRI